MNEPETIREILENAKIIAVIGLSDKPGRASLGVSRFMQQQGYRIIPVNPLARSVLGEQAYATLEDAWRAHDGKIDLVNVFRVPAYVPQIVRDVIRLKIPRLWLQEGVCHAGAAASAEAAGIKVVMDHCLLKERMAAGWRERG
jgi:predicted CoA-binding protein